MLGMLFLLLLAGLAVGFRFLPWPWKLGILGGLLLLVLVLRERLLVWLFMIPFKLKGAALAGASVVVHSLTPTDKPPDPPRGEEEEPPPTDPGPPRRWFALDATVTPPRFSLSPFKLWEPGELMLVAPGEDVLGNAPADACVIASLAAERPGGGPGSDDGKVHGPRRLRLVIGVRPGVAKLRFQYYFEKFGAVLLPPA